MSSFNFETFTCAMCGKDSEHTVIRSTNAFGPMDMDTRPPQMQRSTMSCWVQQCPHCGYACENIQRKTSVSPAFLRSDAYQTTEGHKMSALATAFYREGMICHECNQPEYEFYAFLHAAWACDDDNDGENAVICRKRALQALQSAMKSVQDSEQDVFDSFVIIEMDLLRRTEQFDKVLEFQDITLSSELYQSLLRFEVKLAEKHASGCYTVADAQSYNDAHEPHEIIIATCDIPVDTKITMRSFAQLFAGDSIDKDKENMQELFDENDEALDDVIAVVREAIPKGTEINMHNIDKYIEAVWDDDWDDDLDKYWCND